MLLALLNFPPPFAWVWIATINIINAFHLGFSHPYSYHHISYPLHVNVQHTLHIPSLTCMAHSTLQLGMHFCSSLFGVCFFLYKVTRKTIKRFVPIFIDT
jgi:hypothetical protein